MLKRIFGAVLILLSGVSAAFAVTPIACSSLSDPNPPDYIAGYFIATETNPATQVYSMSQAIMVDDTDAGFVAWQAVQNNCVNTYPTLVSLYAAVNSQAKSNFPNQPTYFSATSAVNVTLTNPLGVAQIVMSTSGKSVILPNMGLYNSPPIGRSFRIINAGVTNSFSINDNASNTIVSSLPPQTYVDITVTAFGGPSFSVSWAYTTAFGTGGTTGTTSATAVGIGGTGLTTLNTPWALISAGSTATGPMNIIGVGATNQFLLGNTGNSAFWGSAVLASAQFANQGTTTTVLHGNAAGNPSFGPVSLTAEVTNTLPAANGGTGVTTAAGEQARLALGAINVTVTGINFNVTNSEGHVVVPFPTGCTIYALQQSRLWGANADIHTAFAGIYTATGGGGTNILPATAVTITATTANSANSLQQLAPTAPAIATAEFNFTDLYLRVTTGTGHAGDTANWTVTIIPLC